MELSETDISRLEKIVLKSGETIRKGTVTLEGSLLKFRVDGTDSDGMNAIKALMTEGLNVFSDGDLETVENWAHWTDHATHSDVTITIADGGLWR